MAQIKVPGWYFVGPKEDSKLIETLQRRFLDNRFVYSVKRFNVEDLIVTDDEKIQGSLFSPKYLLSVVDLSKESVVPFFVEKNIATRIRNTEGYRDLL